VTKRVLVTGATGFVGQVLVARLLDHADYTVTAAVRQPDETLSSAARQVRIDGIDSQTDWGEALKDASVAIHLAARVHVMQETEIDPWAQFRAVNVQGTINLARQAALAGIRRFVYISSIKVNGELTPPGCIFSADDKGAPADPYALSKYEAEKGLLQLVSETEMEVVIIRPPLVYGPGVKANFYTMMKWLHRGVPLPLGRVHNSRSLVAVDNLADLLVTCIDHPAAANQVFLAGDGEDLSTTDLLLRMGLALKVPARLVPVPVWVLSTAAALLGKRSIAQRLCSSLKVDIHKTRDLLNWHPPVSVDLALKKTANHFLEHHF